MTRVYECSSCDAILDESFYICSNCHICCFLCWRDYGQKGECQLCKIKYIYCCTLSEFNESKLRDDGRPLIVLPALQEKIPREDTTERIHSSCWRMCCNRLLKCFDCHKCVSLSRILEHYYGEHKEATICPVPPGAVITFRLALDDVGKNKFKRLQTLQMTDFYDDVSSSENSLMANEGCEKIFFVMASSVPFLGFKENVLLLWLLASFHACLVRYSIEATSFTKAGASVTFTGTPINTCGMDGLVNGTKKIEDIGQYLAIRSGLLAEFEKEGGCVISVYFHNQFLDTGSYQST